MSSSSFAFQQRWCWPVRTRIYPGELNFKMIFLRRNSKLINILSIDMIDKFKKYAATPTHIVFSVHLRLVDPILSNEEDSKNNQMNYICCLNTQKPAYSSCFCVFFIVWSSNGDVLSDWNPGYPFSGSVPHSVLLHVLLPLLLQQLWSQEDPEELFQLLLHCPSGRNFLHCNFHSVSPKYYTATRTITPGKQNSDISPFATVFLHLQ